MLKIGEFNQFFSAFNNSETTPSLDHNFGDLNKIMFQFLDLGDDYGSMNLIDLDYVEENDGLVTINSINK